MAQPLRVSYPLAISILSASVAAASRAGQIIRDVVDRGDLAVVQKVYCVRVGCLLLTLATFQCCLPQDTDNPQTEADRRAHRCIVSSLTARFPNITIISEEVSCG